MGAFLELPPIDWFRSASEYLTSVFTTYSAAFSYSFAAESAGSRHYFVTTSANLVILVLETILVRSISEKVKKNLLGRSSSTLPDFLAGAN